MTTESMTITKALAECKLLDKRIMKKIEIFSPVAIQLGENSLINGIEKNQLETNIQANFQSITELINRRKDIKSKIIKSNSETKIKINNIEITVAEAIDYKNIIELKRFLLARLKQTKLTGDIDISKKTELTQSRLDELLKVNFGKDKAKIDTESYESISKPFLKKNSPVLIDPLTVQTVITKLEDEIDKFGLDIDYILSESNSKTKIEI